MTAEYYTDERIYGMIIALNRIAKPLTPVYIKMMLTEVNDLNELPGKFFSNMESPDLSVIENYTGIYFRNNNGKLIYEI